MPADAVTIFCLKDPERYAHLIDRLDDTEKARAARLQKGAELYIGAHVLLRYAIGARPIHWREGEKPVVADASLHFSLSHCRGMALCAVSRGGAVGVDVEFFDPALAERAVAEEVFCREELVWVGDSPERFFRMWTVKEAIFKAAGERWSEAWRLRSALPDLLNGDRVEERRLSPTHMAAVAAYGRFDWRYLQENDLI